MFLAGCLVQTLPQTSAASIFVHLLFLCSEQRKSACASSSGMMLHTGMRLSVHLQVSGCFIIGLLFYYSFNSWVYLSDVVSVIVQLNTNSEFCYSKWNNVCQCWKYSELIFL